MWRLRSSILSSTSSSNNNNNNNDPPATNRRDPDEEHHHAPVIVMDRPLFYSNVETANDDDDEGGLMVVPPATDDDEQEVNDKEEELSVNPNQLTDSSLLHSVMMEQPRSPGDKAEPEGNQLETLSTSVKEEAESNVEQDNEDEEGVLVDELTQEERDFLASLDVEPVMAHHGPTTTPTDETAAVVTNDPDEKEPGNSPMTKAWTNHPDDKENETISRQQDNDLERMVEEAEFVAAQMKAAIASSPTEIISKQQGEDLDRMVQEAEDFAAQIKAENVYESFKRHKNDKDDFAQMVLPVWRYFTVALGVAALCLFACASTHDKRVFNSNKLDAVSALYDVVSSVDVLPRPAPTPNLPLAPISVPLFGRNVSAAAVYNITDLQDEDETEIPPTEQEDGIDSTWLSWQCEMMYAGSLLVFYYVVCFWIRKDSSQGIEIKTKDVYYVQNDIFSLNSFEGMMTFHKRFKKSGKGRRVSARGGGTPGKFDASSYEKLTRPELLQILDGFERYVGRDAAKFMLIHDLCSMYEDTLYRFSNPQIAQLLKSKGYSVNTNMTKQDLVALAVKVGF